MLVSTQWPQTYEFACHSKACAPPPAGKGGSDPTGGRALTKNQTQILSRIASDKRGWNTATQAEAAPLVKRGLIARVDGKGKGMGNSPLWEATDKGHLAAGTHYRVRRGGDIMKIPHALATKDA